MRGRLSQTSANRARSSWRRDSRVSISLISRFAQQGQHVGLHRRKACDRNVGNMFNNQNSPSHSAPPYSPLRSASHARDSRAIQSQAWVIDSKSPISSMVPSSHSASTYQRLSVAVFISRGLKIGRGNFGMLVDPSAATRAGTSVVELADEVGDTATRHVATMIPVAKPRHPRANSSTNHQGRGGRRRHDDALGYRRNATSALGCAIRGATVEAASARCQWRRLLVSPGAAVAAPLRPGCRQWSDSGALHARPGPPASLMQQIQSLVVCADAFIGGTLHRRCLTARLYSFPLTGGI
jgi:hypothetical protein